MFLNTVQKFYVVGSDPTLRYFFQFSGLAVIVTYLDQEVVVVLAGLGPPYCDLNPVVLLLLHPQPHLKEVDIDMSG